MAPERSADESWELLETTLELGDELDFLLIECSSDGVRDALAGALQEYAISTERPFRAPPPGVSALAWLDGERAASAKDPELRDTRPIYWVPVPAGEEEGFTLARLNENRDNLHRDMRGALCLAGLDGFLDRFPSRAPSIWSFRTKTFSFVEPPHGKLATLSESVTGPRGPTMPPISASRGDEVVAPRSMPAESPYDIYISSSYRDEEAAGELARRLEGDGVRCLFISENAQDRRLGLDGIAAQAKEARFIVPLLSPDYGDSDAWRALERSSEMRDFPNRLRSRMLPVLVRHSLPPPFFAGFNPLDFRSPESMTREYPNLLSAVTGRAAARARGAAPSKKATWHNVHFLALGAERARSVVRLNVRFDDDLRHVSGFFIGPDLVLTCHYCLFSQDPSRRASSIEVWANDEITPEGELGDPLRMEGLPSTIVGDPVVNWAALRVVRPTGLDAAPLPLVAERSIRIGDRVSLIHHPHGLPKKVSLGGEVRYVDSHVFQYPRLSATGSGGAPVFDERWDVVGLQARWTTTVSADGTEEVRSEAIRIERVVEGLRAHGLLP